MRDSVFTIVYTVVLTMIFVAGVTSVQTVTAERVAINDQAEKCRHILGSVGLWNSSIDAGETARIFKERILTEQWNGIGTVYRVTGDGLGRGDIAFPVGGAGFWGPIEGYVGLSRDGKTIRGISFTKHSETPGLGARIDEDWFRVQFHGKKVLLQEGLPVVRLLPEGADIGENSVHAITGASRTSRAVERFLDKDLRTISRVIKDREAEL